MDGLTFDDEQDLEFLRDNDSLYALPLRHVPLETTALRRGRLVKTFPLDSAIEIFKFSDKGMGYFHIDDLLSGRANAVFGWEDGATHPDIETLGALSSLESYDVYNLRINLRRKGIAYEGYDYLNLSREMQLKLGAYMREFTVPLIETVFGDTEKVAETDGNVISLLRNPDSGEAMENLNRLSNRLKIAKGEIPAFLEDFSEVYLAVSYYKHYADKISIMNESLVTELDGIYRSLEWKYDPEIQKKCEEVREYLKALMFLVYASLDKFDRETRHFWVDLNGQRFRELQDLVGETQAMIAGVLCGMGVKLTRWREQFPTAEHGSSDRRFEVLRNEIRPGMGKLMALATGEEDFLRV